ncbi:MAG: LysR family transcriptional regulator substrate-binding protein [Pseudolysinimonas sp.]
MGDRTDMRRAEPFVVTFVPGVTPGKWARVWNERLRREPLTLVPASSADALRAIMDGSAHMALLRDVEATETLHVIPLYREQPVVVTARDSVVAAFDTVTLAELAGENVVEGQDAAAVELIATGTAVAVMPASVARAHSRRDVVARPVSDAPDSGIGLAWLASASHPRIDTFVGIVRGRTENSSR